MKLIRETYRTFKFLPAFEKMCCIGVAILILGVCAIFFNVIRVTRIDNANQRQTYALLQEYKEKDLDTSPNIEEMSTTYQDYWRNYLYFQRSVDGDVTTWEVRSAGRDRRFDTKDDYKFKIDNEPVARKAGKLFSGLKKEFDKGVSQGE